MDSYDVGFIGGGNIAQVHADRVVELGQEVRAVADIVPDVREEFAETYGATGRYEDYEAMLAEEDLDVAVVAVPNALHADCAVAALEADTNVLVEKPLADSLAAAERVADAEADSDAEVVVGFKMAFEPAVETAAAINRDGEFGDVYEMSVEYVRQRGIPQLGSWFTRKELAGGGALIDIGVHMVHLALHVLDFPEIETVSGSAGGHFGSKEEYTYLNMWGGAPTEDAEFDVDDNARALVRTADGTTLHVHVAWASNSGSRQDVVVRGDEAGATFAPGDDSITVHGTDRGTLSETELTPPAADPFTGEWEYLFEVLAGEREHDTNTVEEGVAVQRVLSAVYESAEENEEVRPA